MHDRGTDKKENTIAKEEEVKCDEKSDPFELEIKRKGKARIKRT